MRSRQDKIEARKRGALSRRVHSSQLVLESPKTPVRRNGSNPTTPRNLSMLDSAFNASFEATSRGTTPRQQRKKSTTPRNLGILQSAFNDGSMVINRREVKSPRQTYSPPERTPKRKQSVSSTKPVAARTPMRSVHTNQKRTPKSHEKLDTATVPKRKKSIVKTPQSSTRRKSINNIRKRLRKTKNVPQAKPPLEFSDVEEEPDISDFDSDYRSDNEPPSVLATPKVIPKKKTVGKKAPTKRSTKDLTKPKLIEVKLERLSYTPSPSITKNISSLDVLSQILNEYLSASQPTRTTQMDKKVLRNYKKLVTDHFTKLIDNTLNNENLSRELLKSNKRKEELRNKIYEVRKKHDELLVNLEKLRKSYHLRKRKYESNVKIENSIKRLKREEFDETELIPGRDNMLMDKVEMNLIKLDKVVNPRSGIVNKFEHLNETLMKLDHDL